MSVPSESPWKKIGSDPNRFHCEACGQLSVYDMTPPSRTCGGPASEGGCNQCFFVCESCYSNPDSKWHCSGIGSNITLGTYSPLPKAGDPNYLRVDSPSTFIKQLVPNRDKRSTLEVDRVIFHLYLLPYPRVILMFL